MPVAGAYIHKHINTSHIYFYYVKPIISVIFALFAQFFYMLLLAYLVTLLN